jgi:hypothetical protein
MSVTNIPRLERFFRLAVSLDIDKDDLGRYDEFLNCKVHDLLLRAQAWELTKEVLILIGKGLIDPLDYRAFQADLRRDHDRADRTRVQAFHRRCGRTPERHHPGRVRYCARA